MRTGESRLGRLSESARNVFMSPAHPSSRAGRARSNTDEHGQTRTDTDTPPRGQGGRVGGGGLALGAGLIVCVLCAVCVGCVRSHPELGARPVSPKPPALEEVLGGLAENNDAIGSFHIVGTFLLRSPDLRKRWEGVVDFRRPSELRVEGREPKFNMVGFVLKCKGKECSLSLPREKKEYYSSEGLQLEGGPIVVSPEIFSEMFWVAKVDSLPAGAVQMTGFDPVARSVSIEVSDEAGQKRRLVVEGPPWLVKRNELLGQNGEPRMVTVFGEYNEFDGIWFPGQIEASFPTEQMEVTIKGMRNIRLNVPMEDSLFEFKRP